MMIGRCFACHSPVAWANAKATANTASSLPIRAGWTRWVSSRLKPRVLRAAKSVSISPPPPILSQGDLWIRVGGDHQQVPTDQPGGGQFQRRPQSADA